LNDVLHPESVYEPFTFTAMKATTKYLSQWIEVTTLYST
jgi:hypothetical protein